MPQPPVTPVKRRKIRSPFMLSQFMTVNVREDALRHEARRAVDEGRVEEGDDAFKRKKEEEGWVEVEKESCEVKAEGGN